MKYLQFRSYVSNLPVFHFSILPYLDKNLQVLRNQLVNWEKQRLVYKLKKGLYILNEKDRKINPSRIFLANQIYTPSYVSTEYALGFYNLIPERVFDITSVTTNKTYKISNNFGQFIYQHISQKSFTGFTILYDEAKLPLLIALPEKAIVDFIYLNLMRFKKNDVNIFDKSFRFENLEIIDKNKILYFTELFKNKKLMKVINNFLQFTMRTK